MLCYLGGGQPWISPKKPKSKRVKTALADRAVTPYYHRKKKVGHLLCEDFVEELCSPTSKLRKNMGSVDTPPEKEIRSDQYHGHHTPAELAWLADHPNYRPEWLLWISPADIDKQLNLEDEMHPVHIHAVRTIFPRLLGGFPLWLIKEELQRRHVWITRHENAFYVTDEEEYRRTGLEPPDAATRAEYESRKEHDIKKRRTTELHTELLERWRTNQAVINRNEDRWMYNMNMWIIMADSNREKALTKLTIGEMRAELFFRNEQLEIKYEASVQVHQQEEYLRQVKERKSLAKHNACFAICADEDDEVMMEWEPERILKERVWRTDNHGVLTQLGKDWNKQTKSVRKLYERKTVQLHRLTTEDLKAELLKRQKEKPVKRRCRDDLLKLGDEIDQDKAQHPRTLFWSPPPPEDPTAEDYIPTTVCKWPTPPPKKDLVSELVDRANLAEKRADDSQYMAKARKKQREAYVDYREKEFTEARETKGELNFEFKLEYGCEDTDDEEEDDKDVNEDDFLPMTKKEMAMLEFQMPRKMEPGTIFFDMANRNRAMLDACEKEEVYVSKYPKQCNGCKCDSTHNICDFITMTAHMALPGLVVPKDAVIRYFHRTVVCGSWKLDDEEDYYWAIPECVMIAIEANFEMEEDLVEVSREWS